MGDIEAGIDGALESLIAALTKPLSGEEESPTRKEVEKPERIIFKQETNPNERREIMEKIEKLKQKISQEPNPR